MFSRRRKIADPVNAAELARLGAAVNVRLAADPSVHRLPVDGLDIYAVGDFFTAAERERLMATVDKVARPSPSYYTGGGDSGRSSFTGDVDPWDPFILMLERRIDDLLGIDPDFGETIQGQRYTPGQEFQDHYDHFSLKSRYWAEEYKRGGQRSWTAMAYLNDVEEGGSTDFSRVGISVAPQAGALLVWNNMTADGLPNDNALHAGRPVVRGVKYVLTKWYRARKWH